MNKKMLPIIVTALVVLCLVLYSYIKKPFIQEYANQEDQQNTIVSTNTESKELSINVTVIDSVTKMPIENAIVYTPNEVCYTDNTGKCLFEGLSWGSYGIGALRKDYYRNIISGDTESGIESINLTIELTAKEGNKIPLSFTSEGKVISITYSKGTRSEYTAIKLEEENGEEHYIFDDIGRNEGFDKYINKKVVINGYTDIGYIGWMREETEGIYVESIDLL